MKYLVVYEKSVTGRIRSRFAWSWRCGQTLNEVKELIREAVEFHLEGMQGHGDPIPLPSATTEYITI